MSAFTNWRMIVHPRDVYPKRMLVELRRLAALPYQWGTLSRQEFPNYGCHYHTETWLRTLSERSPTHSSDFTGNIAAVAWIKEGPKVAKVTEQQYSALSKVDVNLELREVTLPYPTMLVVMPPRKLHDYCLVHRYSEDVMICVCASKNHLNDIVTVVGQREGVLVEESLEKYDDSCADVTEETTATLRVAVNMLLALTNFGHQSEILLPKEVADDKSIMQKKRGTEAANRAAERLKIAPILVKFDREVVLHRVAKAKADGPPTGRTRGYCTVRGHWKSQPYGEGSKLRKRIYVAPYLVHPELLIADRMDIVTTYSTKESNAKATNTKVSDDATNAGTGIDPGTSTSSGGA